MSAFSVIIDQVPAKVFVGAFAVMSTLALPFVWQQEATLLNRLAAASVVGVVSIVSGIVVCELSALWMRLFVRPTGRLGDIGVGFMPFYFGVPVGVALGFLFSILYIVFVH